MAHMFYWITMYNVMLLLAKQLCQISELTKHLQCKLGIPEISLYVFYPQV